MKMIKLSSTIQDAIHKMTVKSYTVKETEGEQTLLMRIYKC